MDPPPSPPPRNCLQITILIICKHLSAFNLTIIRLNAAYVCYVFKINFLTV